MQPAFSVPLTRLNKEGVEAREIGCTQSPHQLSEDTDEAGLVPGLHNLQELLVLGEDNTSNGALLVQYVAELEKGKKRH